MCEHLALKIFLIAYEFPPSSSPQSLRWAYLVRELACCGHEVHVLAPDIPGNQPDLMELVDGAIIHRAFPGPIATIASLRVRRRLQGKAGRECDSSQAKQLNLADVPVPKWNWKGRLMGRLKNILGWVLFPDVRGEWNPWALSRLKVLLPAISPDVVISSHEPASTIELGRIANNLGYRWIVDMGDPVLASYTSHHWRRRALRVERMAVHKAGAVIVTSERTRDLLVARHGAARERCHVIAQGFDDRAAEAPAGLLESIPFDDGRLELLYTGSFYAFRRIDWMLEALVNEPGARITVVTSRAPDDLLRAARRWPRRVRLFGHLPHRVVLALQRHCDVLVNIANDNSVQVPGKFYEYLGAGKPIVHVGGMPEDAVAALLREGGHARFIAPDSDSLARLLADLCARKRAKMPLTDVELTLRREAYTWQSHAARIASICAGLA